jgi:hypothetical protein
LSLVFIDARDRGNVDTGDTNNLVQGTRVALDCLGRAEFFGCGHSDGSIQTTVFPYPLLQYLPAAVLVGVGLSDEGVVRGLATLSFVAFIAMLGLAWHALRRRPRIAWYATAGLLGTSALYQATAAFGEMLAATVILGAVVAALQRRPLLVAALCLLACISKETAAPFVVVLAVLAARDQRDGLLPSRRLSLAIAIGSGAGLALSAAFNIFRFGTVRNLLYLSPELHTPGLVRKGEYFAAGIFAPSNGIVWFWPVVAITVAYTIAVTVRRLITDRRAWRSWAPPAVLIVALVAFLWGLASWFTPFGWITFGPRLAVPLLPATFVMCLVLVGDDLLTVFDRLSHYAKYGVVTALVAISVPLYAAPWRWWPSVQQLIARGGDCPGLIAMDVVRDPRNYYRCESEVMWRLQPNVLRPLLGLNWSIEGLAWFILVVACACMMSLAVGVGSANRRRRTLGETAAAVG